MMPGIEFLAPVALFAFSSLVTPGPNNMMVAASGANFGFNRTRPHVFGICLGFAAMVFLVGIGLGQVFQQNPGLHAVLRYVSFGFLCWIAWRIARAGIGDENGKVMSFYEAVLFQWVNPKAWAMAGGATTTFMTVGGSTLTEAMLIAGVFLFLSFPCVFMWALFGAKIGGFLRANPVWLKFFNTGMAVLLIVAMLPVILR